MNPTPRLPPGQQLAAADKWPIVGERAPSSFPKPWSLQVTGAVDCPLALDLDQLASWPQTEITVDIHCVTRWSKFDMLFSGVLLADVLRQARRTVEARYLSFVAQSERDHSTSLPIADALELGTLLALRCHGEPLAAEHGGPLRSVVPGRYFYKSLKWLCRIEVLAEDQLGYWEAEAGYHNGADPWRKQRFVAGAISKQQAARLMRQRDVRGLDLLSVEAAGRDLNGLLAADAALRNANFDGCQLRAADFSRANLSNARFRQADLREARFVDADLEGADFAGADLRQCDLRGASLIAASFVSDSGGALIDGTTQIEHGQLDDLMPLQREFVERCRAMRS